MPEIIDESKIRYIENGEPHDRTVYNRPTRDLVAETDDKLVKMVESLSSEINEVSNKAVAMAIVFGG